MLASLTVSPPTESMGQQPPPPTRVPDQQPLPPRPPPAPFAAPPHHPAHPMMPAVESNRSQMMTFTVVAGATTTLDTISAARS